MQTTKKVAEGNNKENKKWLKWQFINGINDDAITSKIWKQVTTIEMQAKSQVIKS